MGTAIATTDTSKFALMQFDTSSFREVVEANLGGDLSPSDLPRVKVPTGGGQTWSIPSADGETDEKELIGVIVYSRMVRAYWSGKFDGQNNPPECYSENAVIGIGNPGGDCGKCPFAQFGSKDDGVGQACKQSRLIFILRHDDLLPMVLAVPPSSLKPVKSYFLNLTSKATPYWSALTSFGLEKTKSKGGIIYSQIAPRLVGKLTKEQSDKFRSYAESIRPALDGIKLEKSEVAD